MKLAWFHAPWCGVCHQKSPVADQIAAAAGLPLERWDIGEDDGRAQAEAKRIKQVPTLAPLLGDRVPFRLVGSMITPENAAQMLARFTPSAGDASWGIAEHSSGSARPELKQMDSRRAAETRRHGENLRPLCASAALCETCCFRKYAGKPGILGH